MVLDRNEVRRLQKAARDGNKLALGEWAFQFEKQIKSELEPLYRKHLEYDNVNLVNIFLIATVYTLHFSEDTRLGRKRLPDFLEDLVASIEMFRTGEYSSDEYKEELEKCGIRFEDYQYDSLRAKVDLKFFKETKDKYYNAVETLKSDLEKDDSDKAKEYLDKLNKLLE